jgi:hypothetical protein
VHNAYKPILVYNDSISMSTRTWYGLKRPWDKYISQTFGKYTLMSYRDIHATASEYPQKYDFVLYEPSNREVVRVACKNIAQLEVWCHAQE